MIYKDVINYNPYLYHEKLLGTVSYLKILYVYVQQSKGEFKMVMSSFFGGDKVFEDCSSLHTLYILASPRDL